MEVKIAKLEERVFRCEKDVGVLYDKVASLSDVYLALTKVSDKVDRVEERHRKIKVWQNQKTSLILVMTTMPMMKRKKKQRKSRAIKMPQMPIKRRSRRRTVVAEIRKKKKLMLARKWLMKWQMP